MGGADFPVCAGDNTEDSQSSKQNPFPKLQNPRLQNFMQARVIVIIRCKFKRCGMPSSFLYYMLRQKAAQYDAVGRFIGLPVGFAVGHHGVACLFVCFQINIQLPG